MNLSLGIAMVVLLVIAQTALFPLHWAFAAVVGYNLFVEKLSNLNWLLLAALLVSLFGNQAPGIVLLAFTFAYFILDVAGKLLPTNRLTKILLVVLAFPLVEVSLLVLI